MRTKYSFYFITLLLLSAFNGKAQYHITSHSWAHDPSGSSGLDTGCWAPYLVIRTDWPGGWGSGLSVKFYFQNGYTYTSPVDVDGYASYQSNYLSAGSYTYKAVLYTGATPLDSIASSTGYTTCETFSMKFFYDSINTGVYDTIVDHFISIPLKIEVKENGTIVDTFSALSGFYYMVVAPLETIYSFRVIDVPAGLTLTCPSAGIIYDTVRAIDTLRVQQYFGFKCLGGSPGFDVGLNTVNHFTRGGHQSSTIYAYNMFCSPTDATVTVFFSPKYVFTGEANPMPVSSGANSITWDISALSVLTSVGLSYIIEHNPSTGLLTAFDTVHSSYVISPFVGDNDTFNNSAMVVDTVTSSFDPNEISVLPAGYILAGTQLKYTINFENTGNDTAFNISVYDTLSDNVDIRSLNMVMASAVMNVATLNWAGHNIVKFDFPNINLLDSSHHGLCDGAVIFTINSKNGLPDGTTIFNHAGIFFDYNRVVMTDTVENIIGIPLKIEPVITAEEVRVYPNPGNDEVTISSGRNSYNSAVVTNLLGQQLLVKELISPQIKVNVKGLSPGMYYITVKGESGVKVVKFEKQ